MLENKRAVIFDMDGTLMDSMWMWQDIDIEYLGRFKIPLPEDLGVAIEGTDSSRDRMTEIRLSKLGMMVFVAKSSRMKRTGTGSREPGDRSARATSFWKAWA